MYWRDKAVLVGEERTVDGDGYKTVREPYKTQ